MDRNDEEQLAVLRDWWHRNGVSVMAGLLMAAVGAGGWWGYDLWQERTAQQSAAAYQEFLQAARLGGSPDEIQEAVRRLQEDHGGSAYAAMATLQLARQQLEAGDYEQAAETLAWVQHNAEDSALEQLARLRRAEALAGAGDLDGALAVVGTDPGTGFVGAFEAMRGDLLQERDRREEAVEAYRRALEAGDLDRDMREVVRLKLNSLGGEA